MRVIQIAFNDMLNNKQIMGLIMIKGTPTEIQCARAFIITIISNGIFDISNWSNHPSLISFSKILSKTLIDVTKALIHIIAGEIDRRVSDVGPKLNGKTVAN